MEGNTRATPHMATLTSNAKATGGTFNSSVWLSGNMMVTRAFATDAQQKFTRGVHQRNPLAVVGCELDTKPDKGQSGQSGRNFASR